MSRILSCSPVCTALTEDVGHLLHTDVLRIVGDRVDLTIPAPAACNLDDSRPPFQGSFSDAVSRYIKGFFKLFPREGQVRENQEKGGGNKEQSCQLPFHSKPSIDKELSTVYFSPNR